MSVHVSSQVWKDCRQSGERLLVMLAMADCADDEGVCWPSQAYLAERARITERGAQKIIDSLIQGGEIEMVSPGGGRGRSARYRMPRYVKKGEPHSPNESSKGERGSGNRGQERANAEAERANAETIKGEQAVPPNRKRTVKEPSPAQCVEIPESLKTPEFIEAWTDWVRFRRKKRCPLSEESVTRQLKMLSAFSPEVAIKVLDHSITNDYQGLFPDRIRNVVSQDRKPSLSPLELEAKRAQEKTERLKREYANGNGAC